jgi:hypothetical protein
VQVPPVTLPQAMVTDAMRKTARDKLGMDGVGTTAVRRAYVAEGPVYVLEADACFFRYGGIKLACATVVVYVDARGEDPESWTVTMLAAKRTGWLMESDAVLRPGPPDATALSMQDINDVTPWHPND